MLIYTFYPCRKDGTSLTFEAFYLASDDLALARADRVLREHVTADYVAVWAGERRVDVVGREPSVLSEGTDRLNR